eukprot:scaffold14815_cov221-Alexandrium_tamarense.AAC.3
MVEFTAFGIVHCNKALLPNARGEGRFELHVEVIFYRRRGVHTQEQAKNITATKATICSYDCG